MTRSLPARSLKSRARKSLLRDWRLYVMLLPAVIWLVVFCYVPMYGILMAFKEYSFKKGIVGSSWAGFKYFKMWFASNAFRNTVGNTIRISLKCLLIGFPFPILFALLINRVKKSWLRKTVQNITYIPNFISTVVLVSMMAIFFSPNGAINLIAKMLGATKTISYTNAEQFDLIYVISGIWQAMGFNSIIYVAALSGVDPGIYEAAKLDGASTLKTIWHIDLPAMLPTIMMMLILNIGSLLSVAHDKILLMQHGMNIMQTEIISTYVYKIGVTQAQYSYSTAIGLFNAVVNLGLLVAANWFSKRTTDSGIF